MVKNKILKIFSVVIAINIVFMIFINEVEAKWSWDEYKEKYYSNGTWNFDGVSDEELEEMIKKMGKDYNGSNGDSGAI